VLVRSLAINSGFVLLQAVIGILALRVAPLKAALGEDVLLVLYFALFIGNELAALAVCAEMMRTTTPARRARDLLMCCLLLGLATVPPFFFWAMAASWPEGPAGS
jgi:hypothetical protein